MNRSNDKEAKSIGSEQSAQQLLKNAIALLNDIKRNVSTNTQTQVQLIEIELFSKSLLDKIENIPHVDETLQDCIKKTMEHFTKLGNALLKHPGKFLIMNKGQLVFNTVSEIKKLLELIHVTLISINKEDRFYDVPLN